MLDKWTQDAHNSLPHQRFESILIVTSVAKEAEAISQGLRDESRFKLLVGGVGTASAAAATTKALSEQRYDAVISAGIAGGFESKVSIGEIVLANEIIAADLGAETPESFLNLEQLGFGTHRLSVDQILTNKLLEALKADKQQVATGPVLTVSTVTGTTETANKLTERIPGATAEAMEGFGVGTAAKLFDVPVLEVRTISNRVGLRDKDAWRLDEALQALTHVGNVLREVL
jgi:futalosine hydrolase